MTGKGRELRMRIKELTEALEKEQSATSLATRELQVTLYHSAALWRYPSSYGSPPPYVAPYTG